MRHIFILVYTLLSIPFASAQEPAGPAGHSGYAGISGELVLKAYQHTYPGRVKNVTFREGDWTIEAGNEIFYWAEGRLLPASLRKDAEKYGVHHYYIYPETAPDPEQYSPQFAALLRKAGNAEAALARDDRHHGFEAFLYGGLTRGEIERRLVRVNFLGKNISVHRDIAASLERAGAAIRKAAAGEGPASETAVFIASISQIGAYNWREIRGSQRMSYHSWGLAVDIQGANPEDRAVYWLWERSRNENWMLIPPRQRWKPPDTVIRAFENEGYVWGGKWTFYDNMHFEYRPELHEINRLIAAETAEKSGPQIGPGESGQDLHHIYPLDFRKKD
jgi:hypothetical protein